MRDLFNLMFGLILGQLSLVMAFWWGRWIELVTKGMM